MEEHYDIFLSHSRKDTEDLHLLKLVQTWREEFKYKVFADFEDQFLIDAAEKKNLDVEVAEYLRQVIRRCDLFVFVASEKAALANWMPWELGLAHGMVGRVHLYLPDPGNLAAFNERGYLELYAANHFDDQSAREYLQTALLKARAEAISKAAEEQARYMGRLLAQAAIACDAAGLLKQQRAFGEHGQATASGASEYIGEHPEASETTAGKAWPTPWPWFWLWR